MCSSSDFNRFCHIQDDSMMGSLQERIAAFWEATHVKCVRCWRLTLVWWVSRIAITVRGMAHAVAFTWTKRTHHAGGLLQWAKPTGMNEQRSATSAVLLCGRTAGCHPLSHTGCWGVCFGSLCSWTHWKSETYIYIDIFIYKENYSNYNTDNWCIFFPH